MKIVNKDRFFKEGDWIFFEYELSIVKELDEKNRVTSISNGVIECSGDLQDRCFHIDMDIKRISDTFKFYSDKLHRIKINSLNHPDFNRYLVDNWVECCLKKDDIDHRRKITDKVDLFVNDIEWECESLKYKEIKGIRLFRI